MSGADISSRADYDSNNEEIFRYLCDVVVVMVSLWLSSSELTDYACYPAAIEVTLVPAPDPLSQRKDFIASCKCKGTSKYVHRECLDQWRAVKNIFGEGRPIDHNYTYAVSNPNGGNLALQFAESAESDIKRVIFEFWFFNQALKTTEAVLPTSYEAFESSIKDSFAKAVRAYYVLSDLCEINKVAGDASNSEESSIEEYRKIYGNIDCTRVMKGIGLALGMALGLALGLALDLGGKLEGVDRLGCTMEPFLEPTLSVNRAESIGLKGLK
ncbi:protein root hair defective 3 homolog 2 [Tanacetum coccineum]